MQSLSVRTRIRYVRTAVFCRLCLGNQRKISGFPFAPPRWITSFFHFGFEKLEKGTFVKMAAAMASMRNALIRCGLNEQTVAYVMDTQGYDSPEQLLMTSQVDLDNMVKYVIKSAPANVTFPSVAIRKLNAFKYWAEERIMCGLPVQAALFTDAELVAYLKLLRADEIEVAAKKDKKPMMPDLLKQEKEWFKFCEKLKNYLGQIRGAAKVPLSYVVRDHDEVTNAIRDADYTSHAREIAAIVQLSGEHYKVDNESVWEIVKSVVIDGFGWNYVKRFDKNMDGRGAVQALRRQCEGRTSINTRKNKAYLSISGSAYKGHRKAFSFAQYVAIHQSAHNELEDCGEPLPETKKVSDFIAGIHDPSLEAGITCVLSDEKYSGNFEATQQFMGTLVANQAVHRQGKRGAVDDRKVAATASEGKTAKSKTKGKKKLENRYYPKAEWFKLTREERDQILQMKRQAKGDSKPGESKRKASATTSKHE